MAWRLQLNNAFDSLERRIDKPHLLPHRVGTPGTVISVFVSISFAFHGIWPGFVSGSVC